MKKVILEIPSHYLVDEALRTLLSDGFNFQVTESESIHVGEDDELSLDFEDMPCKLIGALVQLKVQAEQNRVHNRTLQLISSACEGNNVKVGLLDLLALSKETVDRIESDLAEDMKYLEAIFSDDGDFLDMTLHTISGAQATIEVSNDLNNALTLLKAA